MENKPQIGEDANCLQTTSAGGNCNSLDQGAVTNSMSSSLDDQGKVSLVYSSQASQGIQSSIASPGLNPMSLPSMSPPLTNLACAATNVVGPSYLLDNVSGVSHNSVGHGPRHYTPCIVSSSQRQMQGTPLSLHTISQQQQQFTQKAPQYMYQLENHVMKQNGHGNMQPSTAQSHIHQTRNHQQTQLQSSLQSLIHKSSGSQTSPSALPQGQTSFMQSSPQSSVQQFKPSALQQPPQAMIRQHQQSQQSLHQQKSPTTLQSALASQQNQRRMVKKTNETAIYQNQAFGQSNNVSNMRHQQEQQWISGAKQQQLLGPQHEASISNMSLQQQMQQATSTCFPTPGPQSQSNASQRQLVSQLQMQPAHLQQHFDQMNPIALQRDVHQWGHKSSAFFESENEMERQKQLLPSQKFSSKASSTSINNAALTALTNTIDGAEEVNERTGGVKPEQSEKLKSCKAQLECCHQFLNKLESNTATSVNLDNVEHRIVKFINGFKYNRSAMLQQQGKQHLQQTQMLYHESQMNPPMQRRSFNSVVTATQPSNPSMHHDSTPPSIHSGIPAPQPEMINALQPDSSLQLQQSAARPIPTVTMNANQQAQMNMVSQNGSIELQPKINLLQQNSNMFFNQQLRQQEHQVMLAHHLKQQLQSNHMSNLVMQQQEQQAVLQRHQKNMQIQNQQQQRHQQQKLPPWNQPQSHQMSQLHQTNEVGDYKTIQGISAKSGKVPYNSPSLQPAHEHVLKTSPYPVSSPRPAQAASPQVSQHSSPQTDQQNLVSCLSRAGTPLQSTNSSIIALSPSTSLAQSPAQGDREKPSSAVSSHSNAGSTVDQQAVSLAKPHSAVISTPGISASPLLAESTATDNNQFSAPTIVSGESCKTEQPHERLLKVIKSIAPKAFGSSIGDADSVLCTVDTMDRSMQDNDCSMFFGESLVGVTKHSSLSKRVVADDEIVARKKMKCRSFAVRSNVVSSDDCIEDRQKHLDGHEIQDLGSSAESKLGITPTFQVNRVMLEEIKEINRKLLTTVVEISDNDDKVISTCAAAQGGVGTIVRCSFRAMALCPDSKLHHTSSQMMPVLPVQLLVSTNYPNCSPVFLDNCPVNLRLDPLTFVIIYRYISKEYDVMFMKAKSWFSRSLRCLTQPMSLEEMAKSWDACASAAMKEHAQRNGGGSFSSRYGTWQNCVNTM
ncbi:hypothetical protein Syun_008792 [Stephania yunnanensis]|uniref:Uncharacterized protein n=1 Tax=Stephania yunnanensis TaxID=152371 RepID=A0AAP0KEZ4_9MAGN